MPLPIFILGSLGLALLDYLFRQLLAPPVPVTTPLSAPYTPPFTGGQCSDGQYKVYVNIQPVGQFPSSTYVVGIGKVQGFVRNSVSPNYGLNVAFLKADGSIELKPVTNSFDAPAQITSIERLNGVDNCGDLPNPNPTLPIGGGGLPSSPPPVLYPPPDTTNNNLFPLIAGLAAIAATALTAATAAAAAAAATAVTAGTSAVTAATAAVASAPSGSTTQQQAQSQKLSADALVGIAQVLAEIAKQIAELEKEIRKLKTKESKKQEDDAKKVIRYDFGSANRDGFVTLYPANNPDGYEATFIDVQIFNIPSGSGKYFGEKSPHYYRYKSLGQIHFVSPTFGILESREIDFARLSLNVPDNCFGFFYHFGLDGVISSNLSGFYTKTEKQAV